MSNFVKWATSVGKLLSTQLKKSYSSHVMCFSALEDENVALRVAQLQLLQARKDREYHYAGTDLMLGFHTQELLNIRTMNDRGNTFSENLNPPSDLASTESSAVRRL